MGREDYEGAYCSILDIRILIFRYVGMRVRINDSGVDEIVLDLDIGFDYVGVRDIVAGVRDD